MNTFLSLLIFLLWISPLAADAPCAFCNPDVIKKQAVLESANFWVLTDYAPITYGHLLIVPKKHVVRLDEMDPNLGNELLALHKKVSDAFEALFHTRQSTIIEKNGKAAGQSVPHVHFHVFPMHEAKWPFWVHLKVFYRILFGSHPVSEKEQAQVVALFREYFSYQGPLGSSSGL